MSESKIIALAEVRQLLAERFPQPLPVEERAWDSGWPVLEKEAIVLGGITEVCSALSAGRLFLDRLLQTVRERSEWAAVIDPARAFDPCEAGGGSWEKVLVLFPGSIEQALKAADALVRDRNLALVFLDLQRMPLRSLGRVPASTWHRFQRLVEQSGTALVVLTPRPIVEAARVRITLSGRWGLEAMRRVRSALVEEMKVQVSRRGRAVQPVGDAFARSA